MYLSVWGSSVPSINHILTRYILNKGTNMSAWFEEKHDWCQWLFQDMSPGPSAKCSWRLLYLDTHICWLANRWLMLMYRSDILVWCVVLAYILVFPFLYVIFMYTFIWTVQLHCSSVCYKLCCVGELRSVREIGFSSTFQWFVQSHFDIKFLCWNVIISNFICKTTFFTSVFIFY